MFRKQFRKNITVQDNKTKKTKKKEKAIFINIYTNIYTNIICDNNDSK